MDEQSVYQPPQAVARKLDVSSATLRRWSDEFATFLSKEADSAEGRNHRRYTDADVATLLIVKELMNNGMTYEQVRQELASLTPFSQARGARTFAAKSSTNSGSPDLDGFEGEEEAGPSEQRALVAANSPEGAAVAFLTNALATLSDSQKSIINSQAANRELLGVLIQDNFNLKEENNRLRERILEVEREMAQARQEEEWRREALRQELDSRIMAVQQLATQALTTAQTAEAPEIKAVTTKPGCLGALFGGGDTRIISVPRRRGRPAREAAQAGPPAQMPPLPSQPPAAHPRPSFPPE